MSIVAETEDVVVREATVADIPQLLDMIRKLAHNEGEHAQVETTELDLVKLLFPESLGERANTPSGLPAAYCLVVDAPATDSGGDVDADAANADGGPLYGMALWYLTTSTWTGRHGIHLEDLYVRSEARGLGIGKALVMTLAALCDERGYPRLEWAVQDTNDHARAFYRSLQAEEMEMWLPNRLSGHSLRRLADEVEL